MYTVYADILFFVNFSMDFLCFYLMNTLFSRKMRILPSVFASLIGAAYGVVSVLLPIDGLLLLLIDLGACGLMCTVALLGERMTRRRILTDTLTYMGISMMLGGVMTALYRFFNTLGIADGFSEEGGDGVSPWLFFLLAVIGGGATLLGGRCYHRHSNREYYDVWVRLCGREAGFRGVIDTGNAVADPITGLRTMMLDRRGAARLLPREVIALSAHPTSSAFAQMSEEYRRRARLLPVHTVTGEGMLLAFRCDACRISCVGRDAAEERDLLLALTDIAMGESEVLLPPVGDFADRDFFV
jgi:stage II sporulation protein GA (sporulation sigma-E factor processing peptidase)